MMKSKPTIGDLHTNGKPDKNLSTHFLMNNIILEEHRKLRANAILLYTKWHRIPLLNSYLRKKMRKAREIHQDQFRRTREIYQQSDEHKKTRGY